jgi:hypothetical protein
MKKFFTALSFSILIASVSFAQCPPATAQIDLDINNVRARMLAGGDLWWDFTSNSHGQYEVPKGSGIMPIYAGALWIGGYDPGGNLLGAMQTYRNIGNDFWPGPLDTANATLGASVCVQYDKIWKINRDKIEEFKYEWAHGTVQNGTYTPDPDILSWPGNGNTSIGQAKQLAPYVDVNHNGIYDPLVGGDYPKIKGDQMLWWVMNDKGDSHSQTTCNTMGIEIHVSTYAYTCPQIADTEQVLNNTTLYHYEIYNREPFEIDSVYIGNWQDGDLGCSADDFVGCYPKGNYSYYYNGTNNDIGCGGELGYGLNPPMISTLILDGPPAEPNDGIDNNNNGTVDEPGEKNLMTHFVSHFGASSGHGDPSTCKEYYNYMSGSWANGNHWLYGGSGFGTQTGATNIPTDFLYSGFPYDTSSWSEITAGDFPGDRRSTISCGPFTLQAGAKVNFDFAVVWSRDTTLPFMSKAFFDKNLHDNQKIQEWFAKDSFPSCLQINLGVNDVAQAENMLSISPNPSSDFIQINYKAKTAHVQFEIIDVMGRTILVSKEKQIDVSTLSSGVYLLKVSDGDLHFAKRFVKE